MAPMIGRIAALYRYPVKSMAGENLRSVHVTAAGLLGDRAYALLDRSTGRVVSAKRPRLWGALLECRAAFADPPAPGRPIPPVNVTLPAGVTGTSAEGLVLDRLLSAALGRDVSLVDVPPAQAAFEYHWPDLPGLRYQGRTYRDEITEHAIPPGTFFDSAPLHLLTTGSLEHLGATMASAGVDGRRFRPNILIDTAGGGFVEDAWVGRTLTIGDSVRIRITRRCIRCVMVTLPQAGLAADRRILTAAFEHNSGTLGIKGDAERSGPVAIGDAVRLE
jgi:uncharacterized protein YcbX